MIPAQQHKHDCVLCGASLVYQTVPKPLPCAVCGAEFRSEVSCEQGHFVCDECHRADAVEWIETFCIRSSEQDPIALANTLMESPLVKMHGPEHHFLVPAVLLTVVYNFMGVPERKTETLRAARKRSESVLGGYCGFQGACGAAIGSGIFMSIYTGATPLSEREWQLSNQLTARALACIAEKGGPRCCKRDSYIAILEAVEHIRSELGINLPTSELVQCGFNEFNKECLLTGCDFYSGAGNK